MPVGAALLGVNVVNWAEVDFGGTAVKERDVGDGALSEARTGLAARRAAPQRP